MLKKLNVVGIIIGIVIMACSYLVFTFSPEIATPDMSHFTLDSITPPEYEANKYYGGDAYTGMQQASAQAANNLIPVFNALEENNRGIFALNSNIIKAAAANTSNVEAIIAAIKYCAGFILLSIGLVVISKSVEIEISLGNKATPVYTESPM